MSLNKYLTLVIILAGILILSNGAYSADPENIENPEETTNENVDHIEQTNVNNFDELKNAIKKVNNSPYKYHEINITEGTYKFNKPLSGIFQSENDKDVTIHGNHAIMDGKKLRDFLTISRNFKVSINNLTVSNMKSEKGIAIMNSGTLILNNVTFENNTSEESEQLDYGGVIFADNTVNMTNCVFRNNGANNAGSAIYIIDQEGENPEYYITNCEFTNNNALFSSTIDLNGKSNMHIINSTFLNENAANSIIFNRKSYLTIDNCSFYDENSPNIIINHKECIINNSRLKNNQIEHIIQNNHNLTLNNTELSNNEVNTIITNEKNITADNSTINNNIIHESLIISDNTSDYEDYYIKINNLTISNNIANSTCGIKNSYVKMYSYVNNSLFINNTSLLDEGIIYDYTGNMHITSSQFINNTSDDLFKGNLNNFKTVHDNYYKGNLLKIYVNTTATANNNLIYITGRLKTDDIYNTSVNSGNILIKQDNTLLYNNNINSETFNLELNLANDNLNSLTLFYDGTNDFRNSLENMEVQQLKEEYVVELDNIKKTFVYGDYVTFDLIIRNTGNLIVQNILLSDVIPDELTYVNSTEVFNVTNNKYNLETLNINENKSVTFYLIPITYTNLNLDFNIMDNKLNKNYHFSENITFIKPNISLNTMIAHPGESINITSRIHNYNKDNISYVKFIFQYTVVNDFSYKFENNILTIENYKISESLKSKNYYIELTCDDSGLEEEFSNSSMISLIKYDIHSTVNYNISNNCLNLTANLFDDNNNIVTSGNVIVKVNGRTVKMIKVNEGVAVLNNYKLESNYRNEYNVSLTYTGNNKYNIHHNNVSINEEKKEVDFIIAYTISNNSIILSINVTSEDNILPESGYVAVKINDKTILPKMLVQQEYNLKYDLNDLPDIHNITVVYYGNENYLSKYKTISA